MSLGDCLVKAVEKSVALHGWLPLISYKVGFVASVALNAYSIASRQPLTLVCPVYFEAMALMAALSVVFYNLEPAYTHSRTQLIAYGKGLGGYLFPLNLKKDIQDLHAICVFLIAAGRMGASYLALDVCLRGKEFKQLRERDCVILATSLGLCIFSIWTIIHVFQIKNINNPDFSICY